MLADIADKDSLILLVNAFYEQVKKDPVLAPIFQEFIGDDWSQHLPIMYRFWNSVLFGAEGYSGQAIGKHIEIDRRIPMEQEHFDHWISLWIETVDRLFSGPNADNIKKKAATTLQLIKYKVMNSRHGKSLI